MTAARPRLRVLVAVTGAFHGRLRVRRSTGQLDTEGLERVLSEPSARAISLAKQLQADGAELTVVHVDKGGGEDILREALSHGVDQGILIEHAPSQESDASVRAATIADLYRQHGPFDIVIGPARSEFAGFSGTLAAVAGLLELPLAVGVTSVRVEGDGAIIGYQSIFGSYELRVPRPSVLLVGEVATSYPTSWGIHDAYRQRGVLRVQADQYQTQRAYTRRVRIEQNKPSAQSVEEVDGGTLVRRLRSRTLLPEAGESA